MTDSSIRSVLVANRGEIACRILKTLRTRGMTGIAVHTDADADAPHTAMADLAVRIGRGPVGDSYLSISTLLAAAQMSGADAVHPGYGFLSENAAFARAVQEAGLVWIGPPPSAIEAMGDKAGAKVIMAGAGVPLLPGYEGADQDADALLARANGIGWPVMIKAAAGGGGRGMRRANGPEDFPEALARARAEALSAFGDARVILERALSGARHIEFQVFADAHGQVAHLGERDCSIQRRHQKVIEEAPAVGLSDELRDRMGQASVAAARAVDYRGAGTVEFMVQGDEFYFLEMNTRLQVEHPVTEMVTGLDLVALQIDVACGLPLPPGLSDIVPRGHAIEARLYAEDPARDFLPATGRVTTCIWPQDARVDSGIQPGQTVTDFYDPMLAKIIVHADDRPAALQALARALRETAVLGVRTNRDFLCALAQDPAICDDIPDTSVLDEVAGVSAPSPFETAAAIGARHTYLSQEMAAQASLPDELQGWSSTGVLSRRQTLLIDGHEVQATLSETTERLVIDIGQEQFRLENGRLNGMRCGSIAQALIDGRFWLALPERTMVLETPDRNTATDTAGHGMITAPLHGRIAERRVDLGQDVRQGDVVVVVEAMKMQHELRAPCAGQVRAISAEPGAQVRAGDILLQIEPSVTEGK